jgi:hypothetical protein
MTEQPEPSGHPAELAQHDRPYLPSMADMRSCRSTTR